MPGGDRTGPLGNGPMTGRQAGYCAGFQHPGFVNDRRGGGFGGGRGGGFSGGRGRGAGGGGFGHRHGYHATGLTGWQRAAMATPIQGPDQSPATAPVQQQQLEALEKQAAAMEQMLKEIKQQISDISERQ